MYGSAMAAARKNRHAGTRAVEAWLLSVAALVFAMVVVGGITRLTGSGLSMVEWRPFMGALPPLDNAEWGRVFDLYRQSPEYEQVNRGMDLAGFKAIFFWEYAHRLLGRLVGLAYGLPLLAFWALGRIPEGYGPRLIGLLALGGLQGVVGWWMVKSGLADDPAVSHYRLAMHLSLALAILAALVWTALDLHNGRACSPGAYPLGVAGVLAATIVAGAFVAGLDAGLLYNEYPFMGDGLVPAEYGDMGWADPFENPASVQFHHRVLALATLLAVAGLWRVESDSALELRRHAMLAAVALQFILGIATLLAAVPVGLGTLHQAGAAVLLATVVWFLHGLGVQRNVVRRLEG